MTQPPKSCCSILLVEDNDDIRDAMQFILETVGYAVYPAANGKEALERLAAMPRPCLILLDLMMPVMNGADFLAAMRADVILAPLPVVVVSAWPDQVTTLGHDVQGFMKKPVDGDTLLRLVQSYCGGG